MDAHIQLGARLMQSLSQLRMQKERISLEDLGDILAKMAQEKHPVDSELRGEFSQIAEYIEQARLEIASLVQCEGETQQQHISHATDQLDAVVKATEEATNQIMDNADLIQQAVEANAPDMRETVDNAVAQIYLACNFQDITGQRITKVLTTLEFIDGKVRNLLKLFGETGDEGIHAQKLGTPQDHLLEGPQLNAPTQDDIDALFASIR